MLRRGCSINRLEFNGPLNLDRPLVLAPNNTRLTLVTECRLVKAKGPNGGGKPLSRAPGRGNGVRGAGRALTQRALGSPNKWLDTGATRNLGEMRGLLGGYVKG